MSAIFWSHWLQSEVNGERERERERDRESQTSVGFGVLCLIDLCYWIRIRECQSQSSKKWALQNVVLIRPVGPCETQSWWIARYHSRWRCWSPRVGWIQERFVVRVLWVHAYSMTFNDIECLAMIDTFAMRLCWQSLALWQLHWPQFEELAVFLNQSWRK